MSWRTVVVSHRAKLDLQLNCMVVRGETTTKVHLSEISVLLIESTEVSLTAALLAELVRLKSKVIFCDKKRNPAAELIGYYGSHDTSSKVRQQLEWCDANKKAVWTEIVRAKIYNQKMVLDILGRTESELLEKYIDELEFDDITNREGHAAKVYFNALFGLSFTRADENAINAALNYGYAIILSICNREIVANGYITQLGLHHSNVFNMYNLGSDLMEPLRPFIDYVVYQLWDKGDLESFDKDEKMKVINALNQEVMLEGKKQVLNYGAKIYVKSIFNALNEEDIGVLRFCGFKDKD